MKTKSLEAILEVKNLKKVYMKKDGAPFTAVSDISFELMKGEIFSFLGPNGAGKTTTINMLTAQLTPTNGEILFKGKSMKDNLAYAKSKIGVVAQHNNLDKGLTARENLIYHGQYFGMSEADASAKADELLKSFGLTDWSNDYVKSFSGGMVQRLKIARAIMHQPEILFLDEPTTGLDPAYREVLWQQVLKLNKEFNTTVFLTTHYMEEPERFSDRVAIYNKGKIKAVGTVEELRELVPSQTIISITLENVTQEITEEVKKLADVKRVTVKDEKNFIVYAENSKKVLNELLALIESKHLNLESINLSATTLDDIFIYLTTNETKND